MVFRIDMDVNWFKPITRQEASTLFDSDINFDEFNNSFNIIIFFYPSSVACMIGMLQQLVWVVHY